MLLDAIKRAIIDIIYLRDTVERFMCDTGVPLSCIVGKLLIVPNQTLHYSILL